MSKPNPYAEEPEPHGKTEHRVHEGFYPTAIFNQVVKFKDEGRESRKSPAKTGDQKQPGLRRKNKTRVQNDTEASDQKTPRQINRQCPVGKARTPTLQKPAGHKKTR